jgi:hypothetical protein
MAKTICKPPEEPPAWKGMLEGSLALYIMGGVILTFIFLDNNYDFGKALGGAYVLTLGFTAVIYVVSLLFEFLEEIDPNKILVECFKDKEGREALKEAYSLAVQKAHYLLDYFFTSWFVLGIVNGIVVWFMMHIQHWVIRLSILTYTMMGILSFTLGVLSYLRYRDYNKKLFLIQLQDMSKTEIAIKI